MYLAKQTCRSLRKYSRMNWEPEASPSEAETCSNAIHSKSAFAKRESTTKSTAISREREREREGRGPEEERPEQQQRNRRGEANRRVHRRRPARRRSRTGPVARGTRNKTCPPFLRPQGIGSFSFLPSSPQKLVSVLRSCSAPVIHFHVESLNLQVETFR